MKELPSYNVLLIAYGELSLRSKNYRRVLTKMLIRNLKKAFKIKGLNAKLLKYNGRIVFSLDNFEKGADIAKNVFGISWLAPSWHISLSDLNSFIKKNAKALIGDANTFRITPNRVGEHEFTSSDLAKVLGSIVAKEANCKVSLKNPEVNIYVEVRQSDAYVFTKRIKGYGGLPVGSSGKVLCMLSGGIDSPVAAWFMMKRGCKVSFTHFHPFASNEQAMKSKVPQLIKALSFYNAGDAELWVLPASYLEIETLKAPSQYRNVIFRRFMGRVAEKVAKKINAKALVLGDSLAQVASQTLDSILCFDNAVSLPVLRPLLGFDKEEIVNIAKEIGTYELSIQSYKDCCSIVAEKPKTNPQVEDVLKIEEKLDVEGAINSCINEATFVNINSC
jgi:thiamine biosynthesis protein ThiI